METEQNRYARGKIYSIRSHQTDKIYIGSTINTLTKRFHDHKKDYKRFMNEKFSYISSFEIIPFDDCYIELIENFPCNSKAELERKEGEHIRATQCVNKHIVGQNPKEYYQNNKEQITLRHKQYYEANKELIKLQSKEYRDANKEKIKEYHKKHYLKKKASLISTSFV